jgi:hypothetical protein
MGRSLRAPGGRRHPPLWGPGPIPHICREWLDHRWSLPYEPASCWTGRSTKQIAEELVLSPHTVQDRTQDVFAKVGVRSRRELVARLAA